MDTYGTISQSKFNPYNINFNKVKDIRFCNNNNNVSE